jgi:hypothetical protein
MSATLGSRFVTDVRAKFEPLFVRYGFHEVNVEENTRFASLVLKNDAHYLRLSCDFRDSIIDIAFGKLVEDLVPPIPIAPAGTPAEVREIPGSIIVWLGTGDKAGAFKLFEYTTADSLDVSVERLATALGEKGGRLFSGDEVEWRRAAELAVTRQWRS